MSAPHAGLRRTRALVVLNPAAHHATALARWARVYDAVTSRLDVEIVPTDPAGAWRNAVVDAARGGFRVFVAAGGDGTVHALANVLVRCGAPPGELILGAVGLGSSNDFHKPVRTAVDGVPLRIDVAGAAPRDLVRATWEVGSRVFAVSASLGLTATANGFFNRPDPLLRILKARCTALAIPYAAVRTLLRHRDVPATLYLDGRTHACALTNLSVLKTPYLSGSFRYDTPIDPASGLFAANLCEGMGRWRAIGALAGLARGRFSGRPGTRSWAVPDLEVTLDAPGDLELDGEVFGARSVRFEVLPRRIRTCA